MIKPSMHLILFLILLPLIGGCAGLGPSRFATTAMEKEYQQKALALEKHGELHQALLAWRVAAALNPKNALTRKIIADMTASIDQKALELFNKGLSLYRENKPDAARQAFIETLHLNPDHKEALAYLKTILPMADRKTYLVQKGDSFNRIAAMVYQDPNKGYLLAYFNDLDPNKPLLTGTRLVLPIFPGPYSLPAVEFRGEGETESVAAAVKSGPAAPREAGERETPAIPSPNDTEKLEMGLALIEKGRYADALIQLEKINPQFSGRDEAISKVKRLMQQRAIEADLHEAEMQLKQNAYQQAYTILKKVIAQSPDNTEAAKLLDQASYGWARELIAQDKEDEAMDLLRPMSLTHPEADELILQAKGKRNARAEMYYRQGVKFYLNEKLERAVEAWKKALALNPDHPKAAGDMENALKLLKKWREINPHENQGSQPAAK